MTKSFTSILCFTIILYSCHQNPNNINNTSEKAPPNNISKYNSLLGTWVRHDKDGFTLIEINDTSNIVFYDYSDREIHYDKKIDENLRVDTIPELRYWYYKSKATMGYWDNTMIWISTDKFRFDYKIDKDTLIEYDKEGAQGKFIRVYTDKEKAFKKVYEANLHGKITYVDKVGSSETFILDNINWSYYFSTLPDSNSGGKIFSETATIGDSIIKPANSNQLLLYKKDTKRYIPFTFVEH